MINGINHITLSVMEIDESFRFYKDVLGFKPVQKCEASAYLLAGETWIALIRDQAVRKAPLPEYSHISFDVSPEHFNAMRNRIISSGALKWQDNKTEGDSHYFLDPDGHKLEIHASDLDSRIRQAKSEWDFDVEWFV